VSDIFEFWSRMGLGERVHPADREVLDRVQHGFDLRCLPGSFAGRLRTAPIVLLYLSPGWAPQDRIDARTPSSQEFYIRKYTGNEPLHYDDKRPGNRWLASRTSCFGSWDAVRSYVAVLNIGAYHSKTFEDAPLLAALPSSRVSLSWAQEVLFPQAMAGERVVVCMRAARFWGLEMGRRYGEALFAPPVTRGGHMLHGRMRKEVIHAVTAAIASAEGELPDRRASALAA
jgi:hypothetical protein